MAKNLRAGSLVALAMVLAIAAPRAASAGELSDDLSARRARAMERLGPDALLVMLSAPTRNYSLDVDYEYRQDSNLYYLTGLTQEETCLVLMPGNATRREILFVRDSDVSREHWNGHSLSHEEAAERSGIRTVLSTGQLDAFLSAMLSARAFGNVDAKEGSHFFEALGAGRARLAFLMDSTDVDAPPTRVQELSKKLRDRFVGFQTVDATGILTALRVIKTPYEQRVLAKATDISADAQAAGMRVAKPGVYEYQVKAAIEAVHRGRGAVSWAYPSIVGSGPNATILHYPEADRRMEAGDLLLVDAACNFEYMSPDITRTYPVTGIFSPAQRDIYGIVLQAQDAAMQIAAAGSSIAAIHNKTVEVIKAGLLKLGLITDTSGDQYRMWYTHGATHYIGIDVHDVGERTLKLEPGMSFVIEPGIYIRQSAIDALPRTAANAALIEKIQPAVTKYANIGVRIEDSFLLTDTGLKRLSTGLPRTIEEVEAFMRTRPAASAGAR